MTYDQYFDKVYGGWFGKCLGGAGGARCEGIKQKLDVTMRQVLDKDIPNDDLDIQLLWLTVLEEKGPAVTADDLAEAWLAHCWYPFGEYGYFMRNAGGESARLIPAGSTTPISRRGWVAPSARKFGRSFIPEIRTLRWPWRCRTAASITRAIPAGERLSWRISKARLFSNRISGYCCAAGSV